MTEPQKTGSDREPKTIVDVLTGKIGKITALVTAVLALLAGVGKVIDMTTDIFKKVRSGEAAEGAAPSICFRPRLVAPDSVSVDEWNDMDLRLVGDNQCETLSVHVAFKARGTSVRIEPPYSEGDDKCLPAEPRCWEGRTLYRGPVDWQVSPPLLRPMSLTKPVTVDINWFLFDITGKQVGADRAAIEVQAN